MPHHTMSWHHLPLELKQAVIDGLDDAYPLSQIDRFTYSASLPALFRNIKLNSPAKLATLLANVPPAHLFQTASVTVDLCGGTDTELCALLALVPRLQTLVITSAGQLTPSVLAVALPHLHTLNLTNIDPHAIHPLSERLVVSLCLSLPAMSSLTLCGISRSALHAPPCFFPVVTNDNNIPPHPLTGDDLSLPNILRISSLKSLVIRDTPLDDTRWETAPIACTIKDIELEGPDAESVLSRVGTSIQHVSLGVSPPPRAPCPALTRLHTTPYFPPDELTPTLSCPAFCTSPISRVDVECFPDDLPDLCHAISDFLILRQKSPNIWTKLERVDVRVLNGEATPCDEDSLDAMSRLIRLCTDLKLRCDSVKALRKWPDGRLRANTI